MKSAGHKVVNHNDTESVMFLDEHLLFILNSAAFATHDLRSGTTTDTVASGTPSYSHCVADASDLNRLFVCGNCDILEFDLRRPSQPVCTLEHVHKEEVSELAISGSQLLSCDMDGKIFVHEESPDKTRRATRISANAHHSTVCSTVCFLPLASPAKMFASGGFDCKLNLWDGKRKKLKCRLDVSTSTSNINPAYVHQIRPLNDASVCLAQGDGSVSVYDQQQHSLRCYSGGHVGPATTVCTAGDSMFASGGDDDRVVIWRQGEEAPLMWWSAKETRVNDLAAQMHAGLLRVAVGGPSGLDIYSIVN